MRCWREGPRQCRPHGASPRSISPQCLIPIVLFIAVLEAAMLGASVLSASHRSFFNFSRQFFFRSPLFPFSRNSYPPAAGSCFTYRVHSEALRGAATEGTGVCVVRRSWVRLQPCALFDLCAEASPCGDGESGRGSQVPQPARSGRLGVQRFGAQTRWVFCGAGRRRRDRT